MTVDAFYQVRDRVAAEVFVQLEVELSEAMFIADTAMANSHLEGSMKKKKVWLVTAHERVVHEFHVEADTKEEAYEEALQGCPVVEPCQKMTESEFEIDEVKEVGKP